MQMQSAHYNKSSNCMIEIPVYILLPDKIGELHIDPLWIEQNISSRMEVLSPRKSPLCTVKVLPCRYQNIPEGTRIKFERWPAIPYSPILFRQYKYTTCLYVHISRIFHRIAYLGISQNHINKNFLTLQVRHYLPRMAWELQSEKWQ